MLPTSHRLGTQAFKEASVKGTPHSSPLLGMKASPAPDGSRSRFGVSVSKKVAGTAVRRNAIRRAVYDAVGSLMPELARPVFAVIIVRDKAKGAEKDEIARSVRELFVRAGLINQ